MPRYSAFPPLCAVPVVLLLLATPCSIAGPNVEATLPLHAVQNGVTTCEIDDPCDPGPPTVEVEAGPSSLPIIYLLASNYEDLAGVQTAFEWPESWVFLLGAWDCLPGQLTAAAPVASGPELGTLTTAFDVLTGDGAAVLGYMMFIAIEPGCLTQVDSSQPHGTHFVSGSGEIDPPELYSQSGVVCAGYAGEERCYPGPTARGVCCRDDGSCDGLWWRCDEDGYPLMQLPCVYCEWHGACCYSDGSCEYSDNFDCSYAGGELFIGQTCDEVDCFNPVEASTWGQIKALHRD
jgi:hypothetical protein